MTVNIAKMKRLSSAVPLLLITEAMMKITEIRTYLMQAATSVPQPKAGQIGHKVWDPGTSRNWLFVKVLTDEGTYGVGECSGWPRVVERAVKDLENLLVGQDPTHIDLLWSKMQTAIMGHGVLGTVGGGALSGIEMALWDIKGKITGQPVWSLLGGRFRDSIPLYTHASTTERADELVALGYKGLKVGISKAGDVETVYRIREHLGMDIDLMVDAHGPPWLTVPDAIAIGRELEACNLLFYEDPVAPDRIDAFRQVREATTTPLAAGERVSTVWGTLPYIEGDLVDVIQPDTGRAGGITQMKKMAAMAEAHYITVAPHSGSLGPVGEFAALHVMATIPNALMLERVEHDWEGRHRVITASPVFQDGRLLVPNTPGLGVDIVEDEIAKHPSVLNIVIQPTVENYEPGTAGEAPYFQQRRGRNRAWNRTVRSPSDDS